MTGYELGNNAEIDIVAVHETLVVLVGAREVFQEELFMRKNYNTISVFLEGSQCPRGS